MALTKGFARNNAKTPLDQRLADMATIVCNADGSPRTGVLGGANASIVSALATWHFRVQAAEFVTSKGKADGVMIYTNDGVVDVPIAAGAPASNSRIDVLWTKHEDNTTGDAASLPIFGVTSGAAAASPVKPAIPTGAEELATLRAYSGTTGASGGANILTNTYRMTAARGAAVPFRTKAELDLWTTPTPFQRAFTLDTGDEYGRAAGAWGVRLDAYHQGNPGAAVAGIDIPGTVIDLPNGYMMKSGVLTSGTSVAFGNEYFPTITFATPFPNKCLHISATPLNAAPVTSAAGNPIAFDTISPTQFRALIPNSGSPWVRAFAWAAFGY